MAHYILSDEDRAILKGWGYPARDLAQIQEAINRSTYVAKFLMKEKRKAAEEREGEVSKETAMQILGRQTFLSGIARSAFHFTSSREPDKADFICLEDGRTVKYQSVHFDSSILFK